MYQMMMDQGSADQDLQRGVHEGTTAAEEMVVGTPGIEGEKQEEVHAVAGKTAEG